MEEISTSLQAVGLTLSPEKLRGAFLSSSKKGPRIDRLFECGIKLKPPDETEILTDDVKPLYILTEEIPVTLDEKKMIVTGISSTQVLTRPLNLKLKKQSEIQAVLAFQAEPLLPYPIEEAILDSQTISTGQQGSHITLQAVKKEHLRNHINSFNELSLEPEMVTSVPAALAHFGKVYAFPETTNPYYVIAIEAEETTCLMGKEGKLIGAHTVPYGYRSSKEDHLQILQNAAQAITSLAKQNKKMKASELFVCGEGALQPHLSEELAAFIKLKLKTAELNKGEEENELLSFSLPIALALCALPNASTQIDFRQNDYAYPNPWKRWKRPLTTYLALCLLLALLIFFFGKSWTKTRESELRNQYSQLLENIGKPYNVFEMNFQKNKMGNKNPSEEELVAAETLSRDQLMTRILFLQTEVSSAPDIFPLLPTVPRVSDFIAWLSIHPKVVNEKKEPQIEILSLQYLMVKRPTQKSKNERYQVRVDLEFTTPIPMIARELHDALLAPNEMVDPKGDVKWSSSRDRYKTSFFLRDRKPPKETL